MVGVALLPPGATWEAGETAGNQSGQMPLALIDGTWVDVHTLCFEGWRDGGRANGLARY
jgi:hypothetical protein